MAGGPYGSELANRRFEYLLQQNPAITAPKAPRIQNKTWELYRSEIETLYPRHTLKQIMEFMVAEYGFAPR
jgi:hypothetical protein